MVGSLFNARLLSNPAVATSRGIPSVQVFRRGQWSSFPGAPVTYSGIIEAPLTHEFATGLVYSQDGAGVITKRKINLIGAYSLYLDDYNEIALGMGLNIFNQSLDQSKLTDNAKVQASNDSGVSNYNGSTVDGDFGVYYNFEKRIGVGFSVPSIKTNFIDKKFYRTLDGVYFAGHANAIFDLTEAQEEEFVVEPSVYFGLTQKYGNYIYVGTRAAYQNKISATLLYDTRGAIGYGIGFMYNNQFLITAYQVLNISDAKQVSGGALEFGLTVFYGETPLLTYD